MKLHSREKTVALASADISVLLIQKVEEYGLTDGEILMVLSRFLASHAKFMIRYERHGDYDTPGGEANET